MENSIMAISIIRFPNFILAALLAGTASGAAPTVIVSGPHATEEFCKILVRQAELGGEYMKHNDTTKRAKYFADQKELNAKLVKSAPASLASDAALSTKAANDMIDAELTGDRAKAVPGLTSPERLAANKRMSDYCGVKF
jgi:hypothetical protein